MNIIKQTLYNMTIITLSYINTVFSSADLLEQRLLNPHIREAPIDNVMANLDPYIILYICRKLPLQDVKHLSEINKHYAKFVRHQILAVKGTQRLNCKINIEQDPNNFYLKFIKAILMGNFKFETHHIGKRGWNRESCYANYGIKDNGDMVTTDDEPSPYDLIYEFNSHFHTTHGKIDSTVKGYNFRHLVGKIHATEKKNSLGEYQANIKTNLEEKFLEHPDKVYASSPIMVSADSNTIVGRMIGKFGQAANRIVPFVCINQKDMQVLSSYHPHGKLYGDDKFFSPMPGYASCVNSNGRVIGGSINNEPAVWIDDNLPFLLKDFIKAPKSTTQKLSLTEFCQISPQGTSWFGYGFYTAANNAVRKFYWIVKFDFDKESVIMSKKRKRANNSQN